MEKTAKEWRKATPEEIKNGSPEMILIREYPIEVEEESNHADETVLNLVRQMTPEGKAELNELLNPNT